MMVPKIKLAKFAKKVENTICDVYFSLIISPLIPISNPNTSNSPSSNQTTFANAPFPINIP
jgi:hypothetical protein